MQEPKTIVLLSSLYPLLQEEMPVGKLVDEYKESKEEKTQKP
jgi:hypothetical protein